MNGSEIVQTHHGKSTEAKVQSPDCSHCLRRRTNGVTGLILPKSMMRDLISLPSVFYNNGSQIRKISIVSDKRKEETRTSEATKAGVSPAIVGSRKGALAGAFCGSMGLLRACTMSRLINVCHLKEKEVNNRSSKQGNGRSCTWT